MPFPNLLVVADGMGGHKAGDFASKFTVEVVKREIAGSRSRKAGESTVVNVVQVANRELIRVASEGCEAGRHGNDTCSCNGDR